MLKIDRNYKEVSGIYLIYNTISNKGYIGSSVNVRNRIFINHTKSHIFNLRRGTHINSHLQASWNKYGEEVFEYYLLATCPPEYLIKMEQWFIDNFKSEYNILRVAGNALGYRFSEESKKRMSDNRKGEKHPFYKKTGKDSHFSKIVCRYTLEGKFAGKYYTGKLAEESTGINMNNIFSSIRTNKLNFVKQTAGGFYWLNFDKEEDIIYEVKPYKSNKTSELIIAENEEVCHMFIGYTEAAKFTGKSRTPIVNYIKQYKTNKYYGYNWRIKEI